MRRGRHQYRDAVEDALETELELVVEARVVGVGVVEGARGEARVHLRELGRVCLPYPSGAFVPIDSMPSWLQGFARHQPVTAVTDSVRHLLAGEPVGSGPLAAVLWSAGIIAGAVLLGGAAYRLRTES